MSQQKTLAFFVGLSGLLALGALAFIVVVMLRGPVMVETTEPLSWKSENDAVADLMNDRISWKSEEDLVLVIAPDSWIVRQVTVDDSRAIIIEDPAEGDPRRGVGIELFSLRTNTGFESWKTAYWQDRAIDESLLEECGVVSKWGTNFYCYQYKDGTVVPGGKIHMSQLTPGVIVVVHYDEADTDVDLNFTPEASELKNARLIQ